VVQVVFQQAIQVLRLRLAEAAAGLVHLVQLLLLAAMVVMGIYSVRVV
jgi:hypothetical protein